MAAASPLAQCSYMSECLDRELEAPVEGWLYLWLAFEDSLEKVYGLVFFMPGGRFNCIFNWIVLCPVAWWGHKVFPVGAIRFCKM